MQIRISALSSVELSWRHIRDALISIPFIHISFCFTFLFFYSWQFGHSIEVFYSPTDVFHVSFKDIAAGYVALFVVVILTVLTTAREMKIAQGGDASERRRKRNKRWGVGFVVGAIVLALLQLVLAIEYWILNHKIMIAAILGLSFCAVMLAMAYHALKIPEKVAPLLAIIAVLPFLASAMTATFAAIDDSTLVYDHANSQPHCGTYAILRNVGDYFLAVKKGGGRYLLDDNCKERFALSST